MDRSLFDKKGFAVAYIADDYHNTIYLWDGSPVAYLYEDVHIYGINGRHLGWFMNDILYNNNGERIGFTSNTCPVAIAKEAVKSKRKSIHELRPRWSAPPTPMGKFQFADQGLKDFLLEGQVVRYKQEAFEDESQDLEDEGV